MASSGMLRRVALVRTDVSSEFLQGPHDVTSQKTPFFIVTAVKTSNITICVRFEVFTAVTMNNGVFWDVTQCGPCKN
jgi:hypothetical protein